MFFLHRVRRLDTQRFHRTGNAEKVVASLSIPCTNSLHSCLCFAAFRALGTVHVVLVRRRVRIAAAPLVRMRQRGSLMHVLLHGDGAHQRSGARGTGIASQVRPLEPLRALQNLTSRTPNRRACTARWQSACTARAGNQRARRAHGESACAWEAESSRAEDGQSARSGRRRGLHERRPLAETLFDRWLQGGFARGHLGLSHHR